MPENNVSTTSKVIKKPEDSQPYQLGSFGNSDTNQTEQMQKVAKLNQSRSPDQEDMLLNEIKNIQIQMQQLQTNITNIENDGVKSRDIDQQVVQALKDLKNYSTFFEQASFQMETKLLKTSLSIAQKIIGIEVSQNSSQIAIETINGMMDKIKNSSKVTIHLSPKDFIIIQNQVNFEAHVTLVEDANVTAGGVVIASDLGNFDGNIEAKVQTMLQALDGVV